MPSLDDVSGEVDIFLPFGDSTVDVEQVRAEAIDKLRTADDQNDQEPVFHGERIQDIQFDARYPTIVVVATDIDGMWGAVWIELNAVEQVEEIQEKLELMKKHLQEGREEDGPQPLGSEAVRAAIEAADEAGVRAVPGDRIIREEATTVDSTGRVELGPEHANEDVRVIVVDDDEPAAE